MGAIDALVFWDQAGRAFTATGAATPAIAASRRDAAGTTRRELATDHPRGVTLAVVARQVGPGLVSTTVTPSQPAEVRALGARLPAAPGEHFYGLGERFGPLDLAGQVLDTWTADQAGRRGRGATSYAPTPFLLWRSSWPPPGCASSPRLPCWRGSSIPSIC